MSLRNFFRRVKSFGMVQVVEFLTKAYFEPIVLTTKLELNFLQIYHIPLTKGIGVWLFLGRTPVKHQNVIKFVYGKEQLFVTLIPKSRKSTSLVVPGIQTDFFALEEFTLRGNMNYLKAIAKYTKLLKEPEVTPIISDFPVEKLVEFDSRKGTVPASELPDRDMEIGKWFAIRKVRDFKLVASWFTFTGDIGVSIYHKDRLLVDDSILSLLFINDARRMFPSIAGTRPPEIETKPAGEILDLLVKHFRPEFAI